jgi:hypothetical protein
LIHLSYLITLMSYLGSPWTRNIQNNRLFVLKTCWKYDSLQMVIFVNVCSTWSMVQLKTRFESWITQKWRKCFKFVLPFVFNNTIALTTVTKCPNQVLYVLLVDLHNICAKGGLETRLSQNKVIRMCLLDMSHIWTKNAFWDVNNRKWRKWCKIVSPFLSKNTYGTPVLTMDSKYPKQQTICAKDGLEIWFSPNNNIRKCLLDMKHGSTKNVFWVVNNTKWRKWFKFLTFRI